MSFCKENQKCESLIFIYNITLGESWLLEEFSENII